MVHSTLDLATVRALKSDRIARMEKLTQDLNEAGIRKTELFTNIAESLRETEGQPKELRRAKAFAHHLKKVQKPVYDHEQLIGSITKELYPGIAERFNTSPSKVERAIRHAIDVAWTKGRIENINRIFGYNIYTLHDKPTNGEFIALLADKLSMEHSA